MYDPKNKNPGAREESTKDADNDAYLPSREDEGYVEPEEQDDMEPEDLDSDDENV